MLFARPFKTHEKDTKGFGWFVFVSYVSDIGDDQGDEFERVND